MRILLILFLYIVTALPAAAQEGVYVDGDGVMRWRASDEEVALFGVNYSTPFAFAYRAHERLGIPHEEAIDADVVHMKRLGFDAYRIHVWDREVSDAAGNLLENDHLRLLDYLIARLKERDISILLTPIAWWGNGWPEPDGETSGFSNNYSRSELSSDPEALSIQQNYIRQFLDHVNPYTGLAYKDDPDIIAFELFNEPRHPEPPSETTRYIDALVETERSTGLDKPIFYNVSQNWSPAHAGSVAASRVDGVSFQWYPAGLVRGRSIDGNALPHVDRYPIPAEGIAGFGAKARMVYEFDAADVLGSYIYPAMARSFREAGMQWATQFSYDPLAIADVNTEYSTHFVNLVYAPAKAVSLMIAAEAFRRLPRKRSYGTYPANTRFGPVNVSYESDRSELNAADLFYHSGPTDTHPVAPDSLRRIAGVGTSPLVTYDGTGAYFFDRLADGLWRLEVYPDAVRLRDPYGPTTAHMPVSRIISRRHPMAIHLADLGSTYLLEPLTSDTPSQTAIDGHVDVEPGVYLLRRSEEADVSPSTSFMGGRMDDFFLPEIPADIPEAVRHTPPSDATAGEPLQLHATVVAADPPDAVYVYVRHHGAGWFERFELTPDGPYDYRATFESEQIRSGQIEYFVAVQRGDVFTSYPGSLAGQPWDWDFPDTFHPEVRTWSGWIVPVAPPESPLVLFDAGRDQSRLYYPHQDHYVRYRSDFVAGSEPHRLALQALVESLEPEPHHFALQASVIEHVDAGAPRLGGFDAVAARVRTVEPATRKITFALITSDGGSWSADAEVTGEWSDVIIPLDAFRPAARVLLPRPYPFFLPYRYDAPADPSPTIDLREVEAVEFSIGSAGNERNTAHGYEVERVMLVKQTP